MSHFYICLLCKLTGMCSCRKYGSYFVVVKIDVVVTYLTISHLYIYILLKQTCLTCDISGKSNPAHFVVVDLDWIVLPQTI